MINDISDHYPNFLFLEYAHKRTNPSHISYRSYTENNIEKFNEALRCCDMTDIYATEDPNVAYNHLIDKYTKSLDNTIPMKTVRFNKYKHKIEPWVTAGILQSIKHRDKLHRKLIKEKKTSTKERLKCQYNEYRNMLNKMIRSAKFSYQHQRFEQCKHDNSKICKI